MSDWTAGYLSEIGYTLGYYPELNPLRLQLLLANASLACPEVGTACELGFGQGMSVNLHAAASQVRWFGTDFNPAQAGFARELASASGAGAQLFDQSFAEFCSRPDLPDFDYIGLHGIWSWVSDENRAVIVDFIRRKLKVGGVLYASYNTQPGWAAMVPMRDLLTRHGEVMGAAGQGIVSRIDGALDFAEKLLATNPTYARANPHVAERLKTIKGQDRNYVAHEYFNRDWLPMPFARMAEWLAPAKLNYACSASHLDHIDPANLTAEQQAFLKDIPDAMFRETVRDFMVNQQFRRDYWVRGARRLNSLEQLEALRKLRVILVQPRADVALTVTGSLGEATLQVAIAEPILELLADHQAKTLGQIELAVKDKGVDFARLMQAVMVLTGAGSLVAVQDDATIARARPQTDRLNAFLCDMARGRTDTSYLASPVTGGGVAAGRFQQLFLLAMNQGLSQPADWAQFVWQMLLAQGQRIIKEGKPLESPEENVAELSEQAQTFAEKQVPILIALGIA